MNGGSATSTDVAAIMIPTSTTPDDDVPSDFADYLALANNFGSIDAVWEDGDLDGNGKVEFADFLILSANFGNTRPQSEPASSSEESQSLELLTANASDADKFFEGFEE